MDMASLFDFTTLKNQPEGCLVPRRRQVNRRQLQATFLLHYASTTGTTGGGLIESTQTATTIVQERVQIFLTFQLLRIHIYLYGGPMISMYWDTSHTSGIMISTKYVELPPTEWKIQEIKVLDLLTSFHQSLCKRLRDVYNRGSDRFASKIKYSGCPGIQTRYASRWT